MLNSIPQPIDAPVYRGLTRAQLDAAYNNLAAGGDRPGRRERWDRDSAHIRAAPSARLDIPYADRERTKLDYLPCGAPDAPLFVFIHGGYWQRNHKDMFAFIAQGLHPHGIDVATIGYTLAPRASLTEIVSEVAGAISFLAKSDLGFDAKRMIVGGWSAGGHLTALMARCADVKRGVSISGIFDLEPISYGFLNDNLRLTGDEIMALSPARTADAPTAPLGLFVGSAELPEFRWQSENFAANARSYGRDVTLVELLADHTHFTILDELSNPEGRIARHVASII